MAAVASDISVSYLHDLSVASRTGNERQLDKFSTGHWSRFIRQLSERAYDAFQQAWPA